MPSAFAVERGDLTRDRDQVIAVLQRNFPSPTGHGERFRHYYEASPLGEPVFWVARESDEQRVIGMIAVIPALARIRGEVVRSGIQSEYAVDEAYRGAFGPAVPLVRAMTAWLDESDLAFSYGNPSPMSHAIVSSLTGTVIGTVDALSRPVRIDRLLPATRSLPALLRAPVRAAGVLLRLRYRDDRHRLWHRRMALVTADSFDARFEKLWRETFSSRPITGERNAEYLSWKYGFAAGSSGRPHSIVAVGTDDDPVAGYAVVTEGAGKLLVHDLLVRHEVAAIDALLGQLLAHARRRGVASVVLTFFGADELLIARLRSFGFVPRGHGGSFVVRPGRLPSPVDLLDSRKWYFVRGDEDI